MALCGVIWIDTLKPQNLSFSFLAGKPLSLIMTAAFFLSLALNLKKLSMPTRKAGTWALGFLMLWITLTTYYAQFQGPAWFKYDYVIKTLIFAFFIPFILDTRVKIETFMGVLLCSIAYYTMIGGMRTFFGGGQYGEQLVWTRAGDAGISETSTLSMVAVLALPFIFYLTKNSLFVEKIKPFKILLFGFALASTLAVVGTYARTGLVGLIILFGLIFLASKQKFKILLTTFLVILISLPLLPSAWKDRMLTITSASDDTSAFGRVVVWRWTIDYVSERPFMGGGFDSYIANAGALHKYTDIGETQIKERERGKAFHNIFFEVLGETGYVGLLNYLLLIFICWYQNRISIAQAEGDEWRSELAMNLNRSLIIYCGCGMFIGIAFSPWLFYFLGLSTSLHNLPPAAKKESAQ